MGKNCVEHEQSLYKEVSKQMSWNVLLEEDIDPKQLWLM